MSQVSVFSLFYPPFTHTPGHKWSHAVGRNEHNGSPQKPSLGGRDPSSQAEGAVAPGRWGEPPLPHSFLAFPAVSPRCRWGYLAEWISFQRTKEGSPREPESRWRSQGNELGKTAIFVGWTQRMRLSCFWRWVVGRGWKANTIRRENVFVLLDFFTWNFESTSQLPLNYPIYSIWHHLRY